MEKILSLPVRFDEREFYTLVRIHKLPSESGSFELKITIMNGELESQLQGNHVFFVKDGKMHVDLPSEEIRAARLKLKIAEALNKYFEDHPLG